mgnify:CR=1 FL=1
MEYRKIEPAAINGNPFSLIGGEWALVTAQKNDGTVNTMTISWGSMGVLWGKNVVQVYLRPQRYTKEFVDEAGRFTLSFYGPDAKKELGYLGKVSGRDEDKIAKIGFTVKEFNGVPAFDGARLVFVCRSLYTQTVDPACFLPGTSCDADWYPQKDYHTQYVAEIEAVYEKVE